MILVIGYGNTACGDDGVGPFVVGRLANDRPVEGVEYRVAFQLTPELAEPISRAEAVIFVDAAVGERPGHIHWEVISPEGSGSFTHHVTPGLMLSLAGSLYGSQPVGYLYSIEGETFELGKGFSAAVEAALPGFIEKVRMRIGGLEK